MGQMAYQNSRISGLAHIGIYQALWPLRLQIVNLSVCRVNSGCTHGLGRGNPKWIGMNVRLKDIRILDSKVGEPWSYVQALTG